MSFCLPSYYRDQQPQAQPIHANSPNNFHGCRRKSITFANATKMTIFVASIVRCCCFFNDTIEESPFSQMLISPYHKQSHLICQSRDATTKNCIKSNFIQFSRIWQICQHTVFLHISLESSKWFWFVQTLASLNKYKPTKKIGIGAAKEEQLNSGNLCLQQKKLDPSNPLLPSFIRLYPSSHQCPSKQIIVLLSHVTCLCLSRKPSSK